MKQYKRITIKIGSQVLTRADGTLDITRVSSLVDQIAAIRRMGIEVVVISSGAVACGRSELRGLEVSPLDKVSARQLYSAVGQVKLINRYSTLFGEYGMHIGQVLTEKENFSTRRSYLNQRNCMQTMLQNDVIPIVNENDTVSITELMFTDNDELSGLVAAMLDCDALIILSAIDGIYDGNPSDPASRIIPLILPTDNYSHVVQGGTSAFGRGGMVTKYRMAAKVAAEGIRVVIANGKRDGILTDLLTSAPGTPCTVFEAATDQQSSLKRWIAHSEGFAKGAIRLNERAAKVITSPAATSVLPVGVVEVVGDFEKDDLINVLGPDGRQLGLGRSAYSADEARASMGTHGARPLIHYDYLYLE